MKIQTNAKLLISDYVAFIYNKPESMHIIWNYQMKEMKEFRSLFLRFDRKEHI